MRGIPPSAGLAPLRAAGNVRATEGTKPAEEPPAPTACPTRSRAPTPTPGPRSCAAALRALVSSARKYDISGPLRARASRTPHTATRGVPKTRAQMQTRTLARAHARMHTRARSSPHLTARHYPQPPAQPAPHPTRHPLRVRCVARAAAATRRARLQTATARQWWQRWYLRAWRCHSTRRVRSGNHPARYRGTRRKCCRGSRPRRRPSQRETPGASLAPAPPRRQVRGRRFRAPPRQLASHTVEAPSRAHSRKGLGFRNLLWLSRSLFTVTRAATVAPSRRRCPTPPSARRG